MQRINYKVEELINQLPQKIDKQVFLQKLNNQHPYYPIGHNMLLALLEKNDFTYDGVKQKATYFFDTKFLFDKNFNAFSQNYHTANHFYNTQAIDDLKNNENKQEGDKIIETHVFAEPKEEKLETKTIYNEVIDEETIEINNEITIDNKITETVIEEISTNENAFVALEDINSFSFFDKPNVEEVKNDKSLVEEVLNHTQETVITNKPESIHDEIAATIAMFQSNSDNGVTQNKPEEIIEEKIYNEKTTEAVVEQIETINDTKQNNVVEVIEPIIIQQPDNTELVEKNIETKDFEQAISTNEITTKQVAINNNDPEVITTEPEKIITEPVIEVVATEPETIITEPLIEIAATKQETIIVEPIIEPASDIEIKKEVVENEMIFEPLYVSDYFAATGVKISQKDFEKSNLMGKVQKFTEWLKMMKNIDSEKLANQLQPEREAEIKTIANKSNVREEILTEAMADIYAKQGKKDKAKVLFVKLSLLNPSKSTYFAAKINALEGSI